MRMKLIAAPAMAISFFLPMEAAIAGPIVSPVSVAASSTDPSPYFTAINLINHNGLLTDYFSGISDFDGYIAGDPLHSDYGKFAAWFSDAGQTGAILTFDMGSVMMLDGLALWNVPSSGVGSVAVALSDDGLAYTGIGSFSPTDWPAHLPIYGADTFAFSAASAQFIQLTLSGCPQPDGNAVVACGLGEVAFRQAVSPVPEPVTLAMFGAGLAGAAVMRRRRKADR